jgi:hypothetical protein
MAGGNFLVDHKTGSYRKLKAPACGELLKFNGELLSPWMISPCLHPLKEVSPDYFIPA